MPNCQGRCERCGAFIREDRKPPLAQFDERYGRLCWGCALIARVAWPSESKQKRHKRVLRRALKMMLAGRDSVPISVTDRMSDREAAQLQ